MLQMNEAVTIFFTNPAMAALLDWLINGKRITLGTTAAHCTGYWGCDAGFDPGLPVCQPQHCKDEHPAAAGDLAMGSEVLWPTLEATSQCTRLAPACHLWC